MRSRTFAVGSLGSSRIGVTPCGSRFSHVCCLILQVPGREKRPVQRALCGLVPGHPEPLGICPDGLEELDGDAQASLHLGLAV